MIKPILILFLTFILMSFSGSLAKAQELVKEDIHRPKIGLVLSGGGAKGLAHIGVLKVLEELDIRPNYITGTSMGAVIGGLYSIGYTAAELDSLNRAIDWNSVFADKVSFDMVGINVKHEYFKYQLNFSGNSFKEIRLPMGLVQGQLISEMLSDLSWRVNGNDYFDDFPIPFRCIAADIITGKQYVFSAGSLATAIRASMAIPTAFTPIVQDGMLLVDGGLINNFPVQECIDMGADIIIGVYVGTDGNTPPDELNTMLKIMSRSASFLGVVNAKEQLKQVDINILPDLKGASVESFGKAVEIMKIGEDAARSLDVFTQLKALSDSLKSLPEKQIWEQTTCDQAIEIDKIRVYGLKHVKEEFVIAMAEIKENTRVDSKELNKALKRLYATMIFEKIEYRFIKNGAEFDLVFDVIEKDLLRVSTGVYYDNYFGAELLLYVANNHFLLNSSKLELNIDVSQFPRGKLSYSLIRGERKRLLFSLGVMAQSIDIPNFYEFPNSVIVSMGEFRNDRFSVFTSAGLSITQNSKLQIEASHTTNYFRLKEGLDSYYKIKNVSANNFSLEASFKLNTFDHPFFPTKGARFDISLSKIFRSVTSFTSSDDGMFKPISRQNEILEIDYMHYFRIARKISIIPEASLGLMSSIPFYADKFFLGGSGFNTRKNTFNQAGVQPYRIATDNFLKLGLGLQLKVIDNWYLNALYQSAIFLNNAETSSEQSLKIERETISGWGANLAYNSVIGPVKLMVSQNTNNSEFSYHLSVGFPF